METIRAAAIRFFFIDHNRKPILLKGSSHGDIEGCYVSLIDIHPDQVNWARTEYGFETSSGRFVDRSEAYKIAANAGQLTGARSDMLLYSGYVRYK